MTFFEKTGQMGMAVSSSVWKMTWSLRSWTQDQTLSKYLPMSPSIKTKPLSLAQSTDHLTAMKLKLKTYVPPLKTSRTVTEMLYHGSEETWIYLTLTGLPTQWNETRISGASTTRFSNLPNPATFTRWLHRQHKNKTFSMFPSPIVQFLLQAVQPCRDSVTMT